MPTIQTETTPNPDSIKLTCQGETFIDSGMESFKTPKEARNHELGKRLFNVSGVDNVFITPGFVTVTKKPGAQWERMLPKLKAALNEHLEEQS